MWCKVIRCLPIMVVQSMLLVRRLRAAILPKRSSARRKW